MESRKRKFHYGYIIVIAALIQYFISGGVIFGASGVFVVPVTTSMGISNGEFMLYMTFLNAAMAVAATFIAPKLLKKFKYTKIDAAAFVVGAAGMAMMGIASNSIMFYIAGILMGFACCILTFLAAGTLIPRWFKSNQGSMIATVLIGTRLGGIVFNPVASKLINSAPLFGFSESWRSTYILLAIILVVIGLPIALFILKDSPAEKGLNSAGDDTESNVNKKNVKLQGVSSKVAVRSSAFIYYIFMIIAWNLACTVYNYLSAYASSSYASQVASFDLSGFVGSFAMGGALIGGYIIGSTNDKFGGHIGGALAGIFGAVGLAILLLASNSPVMIIIGSALFGVYYAISGVQMPAMVNTMFGNKDYDSIFRAGAKFAPWFGAVSSSMWGFVYDINESYNLTFILAAALCVLTAIFGIVAVQKSKKLKSDWVSD